MIISTKTHKIEYFANNTLLKKDAKYFLDFDIAILRTNSKEYQIYLLNIRKEYRIYFGKKEIYK